MKLEKIIIDNFKGIKHLEILFDGDTKIQGRNASGKTTLFDAVTWLFFGKDSLGSSVFDIKPIGTSNIINSVEVVIDGKNFKKTQKEMWVKKRNSVTKEFSGNICEYYFENIELPINKSDFVKHINEMFDEQVFKLITNPLYFCSLNWKEQRLVLISLLDTSKREILKEKETELLTIKSKLKKVNSELESFPIRIDEAEKNKPLTNEKEENLLKKQRKLKERIKEFEDKKDLSYEKNIGNLRSKKDAELNKINSEKNNKEKEINRIKSDIKLEEFKLKENLFSEKSKIENDISKLNIDISSFFHNTKNLKEYQLNTEKQIEKQKDLLGIYRNDYSEIDNKNIEVDSVCPTCKQDLPETEIKEIKELKKQKLNSIIIDANNLKNDIAENVKKLTKITSDINENEEKIEQLKSDLMPLNEKLSKIVSDLISIKSDKLYALKLELELLQSKKIDESNITKLDSEIENIVIESGKTNVDLDLKIENVNSELKNIGDEIQKFSTIKDIDNRIEELKEIQSNTVCLWQELSKNQNNIENGIRNIVSELEENINKNFEITKFKLFETQINGGLKEICEATDLQGTPYSSLNNAMRINCGLDIINTICKKYNCYAPIFIDNSESVNNIHKTKSQQIQLCVVDSDTNDLIISKI